MKKQLLWCVAAVAASAVLSAFAADVPPPCAPVPVQKTVKVERREIAVSIIGKGLLSRARCGSVEEMIAYWTAAMDEEIGNKPVITTPPLVRTEGVTLKVLSTTDLTDWSHPEVRTLTISDNGKLVFPLTAAPARFFKLSVSKD